MNGGPLRTDYKLEGCKQEVYDLQARLEAMRLDRDYYRAQRDRQRDRAETLKLALRDAVDVAIWLTGLGEIPTDSAWPQMREKLNASMQVLLDAGVQVGEPEWGPDHSSYDEMGQ